MATEIAASDAGDVPERPQLVACNSVGEDMTKSVYQWKKGDSLDKVAKANGLKDADAVWDDPANKAIVKIRKKPTLLQPGDKLVIPRDEIKVKQLEQAIDTLQHSIDLTMQGISNYDKLIASETRMTDDQLKKVKDAKKNFDRSESILEIIEFFVEWRKGLAKIGNVAFKEMGTTAKELAAATKQVTDGSIDLNKEVLKFGAFKSFDSHKDSANKSVSLVSTVVGKLGDLTSPVWWGIAIDRKLNGAKFSEALMGSIDDDLDQEIKEVQKSSQGRLGIFTVGKQRAEEGLAILAGNLKIAQDQLKLAKR